LFFLAIIVISHRGVLVLCDRAILSGRFFVLTPRQFQCDPLQIKGTCSSTHCFVQTRFL